MVYGIVFAHININGDMMGIMSESTSDGYYV